MEKSYDDNVEHIERLLRRICFEIKKKGRELLSGYNITPPQFDALQRIRWNGEMTIGELSNTLYLAPSTITDLVDRMEKNELVERIRDTKDRRVVKVSILTKGCQLIENVLHLRCEFISEILVDVPDESKKEFIKYLEIFMNSNYFNENN